MGGVSRFSVEKLLSLTNETFRNGLLHCCIILGYRKCLDKRRGDNQNFPSKIVCLTVPRTSVGEPFTVALN